MQCPVKAFHCYSKNFHAFPLAAFLISSLVRAFEAFRANLSSGKSSFRNVKRAEDLGHTFYFVIATIQYENKGILFYLYFILLFDLLFLLILRKIFEKLAKTYKMYADIKVTYPNILGVICDPGNDLGVPKNLIEHIKSTFINNKC